MREGTSMYRDSNDLVIVPRVWRDCAEKLVSLGLHAEADFCKKRPQVSVVLSTI
jgi:hypothetical protein